MRWFLSFLYFLFYALAGGQEYYYRQMPDVLEGDVQQINLLFQSSDRMIWLGTEKGIYSFDGRKYKPFFRPDGLPAKVTAISESPEGTLWVGYEEGYIHAISLQGYNQAIDAAPIKGASISKIVFHTTEKIFITTYGKGVWLLEKDSLTRLQYGELATIDDVYDAIVDLKGRLWLATDNGIWIYHKAATESLIHLDHTFGLPDEIVNHMELASNGDVWIGLYDHGLARYPMEEDTVLNQLTIQSSEGSVIALVKGKENEVWIGTERAVRVCSLDGKCNDVKFPAEMKDRLESLHFDRNGNLWLASGNKLFVANTQIEFIIPGVAGIQAITTAKGKLWLGCKDGLYNIDQETRRLTPLLQSENINVLSLYADLSGVLWIGTFGQGLYLLHTETNRLRYLSEADHISNNSILNIDGRENKVWLATLGGITEIRWESNPIQDPLEIIEFQTEFNFPAGYVYDVYVSEKDRVWFGTDGKGLYYLDQNQLRPFVIRDKDPTQEEDYLKTIYSITTGGGEKLWISGSKGQILLLDEAGQVLDQVASSQGSINSLIHSGENEILMICEGLIQTQNQRGERFFYNESSGLKSFLPNINATATDADGSVWIADTDRILHFIPLRADTNRYVQLYLEATVPALLLSKDEVRLEQDSNFLDIRFTGLWYQNPSEVRYRYKLEGHDQDWIYTREGRAVYSSLSPGAYTFVVAGSHTDDFSSARILHKQIIVLPPIYLRWWFILCITLLVAWMIYAYTRARIKRLSQLHQLEKEKTTLQLHAIQAQVNPHFLFNSFNTLSNIIEEDQVAAVDYVDQLSGFFRGVLMHRDAELIRMEEELEIVRNYTYILQKRYGNNLRIIESISHLTGWIAPLSIQLLVENAIKHNIVSADKPLSICISIDDSWVQVSNTIQPKIQMASDSTGFGLSSLVTRYQYLTRKKIEILREQNTFTVKIPVIPSEKPV